MSPFVPFHKGSTTVQKKGKVAPAAAAPTQSKKQPTKVPKPVGQGPAGAQGYFDN